jgi:hypothetical protein
MYQNWGFGLKIHKPSGNPGFAAVPASESDTTKMFLSNTKSYDFSQLLNPNSSK